LAGLDRSFVKEEESHTAPLLRLAASPLAVWLGKLLFNLLLIYLLLAILVPLFCILMGYHVLMVGQFVLILALGGYALAVTTTIVAAIIARALTRGALFSVLSLPADLSHPGHGRDRRWIAGGHPEHGARRGVDGWHHDHCVGGVVSCRLE
jgi:ABC-type transport system involved in cytochrome c biogenesis permease component